MSVKAAATGERLLKYPFRKCNSRLGLYSGHALVAHLPHMRKFRNGDPSIAQKSAAVGFMLFKWTVDIGTRRSWGSIRFVGRPIRGLFFVVGAPKTSAGRSVAVCYKWRDGLPEDEERYNNKYPAATVAVSYHMVTNAASSSASRRWCSELVDQAEQCSGAVEWLPHLLELNPPYLERRSGIPPLQIELLLVGRRSGDDLVLEHDRILEHGIIGTISPHRVICRRRTYMYVYCIHRP